MPLAQEDGIGTPAAFAACRMLWPGAQSKLRPELAKVIRRAGADGAAAGGASLGRVEVEALLEIGVVGHAAADAHAPDRGHEALRPAAEHAARGEVGHGAEEAVVQPPAQAGQASSGRLAASSTRSRGRRRFRPANSSAKITSAGVRAAWTNTTSRSRPRSAAVRRIDAIGVTPLPAETSRTFALPAVAEAETAGGAEGVDPAAGAQMRRGGGPTSARRACA